MIGVALGLAFLAGAAFGPWAVVAGGAAAPLLLLRARERWRLRWPLLAVIMVAIAGAVRGEPPPEIVVPAWIDDATGVQGRVTTAPVGDGRFQRFVVTVEAIESGGERQRADGRVYVVASAWPRVSLADRVVLRGLVTPLPDQPERLRAFLRSRRCVGTLTRGPSRSRQEGRAGGGVSRALARC